MMGRSTKTRCWLLGITFMVRVEGGESCGSGTCGRHHVKQRQYLSCKKEDTTVPRLVNAMCFERMSATLTTLPFRRSSRTRRAQLERRLAALCSGRAVCIAPLARRRIGQTWFLDTRRGQEDTVEECQGYPWESERATKENAFDERLPLVSAVAIR